MKKTTLGIVALLAIATLAGCNKTPVENPVESPVENPGEEVQIANPASVYCEENGGTLNLEEGLCMFEDGSYCEEWSYYRNECQPGEIIYNTVEETETALYTQEDLSAAIDTINYVVNNEWQVKVENFETTYAGDEAATNNLEYCQSLNAEIEECAVFTSSFHIPEQDVEMAGAFEPNKDMEGRSWYLGRTANGERTVLTNGLG